MTKYYVYALINPITNQPFYIGKGTGNRCYAHLNETFEQTQNNRKFHKIQQLNKYGHQPIVKILEYFDTEKDAYQKEEYWIAWYGRYKLDPNGILMNLCGSNRPFTRVSIPHKLETKEKMRQKALARPAFSEDHKIKLAQARSRRDDKPLTENVKQKIANSNKKAYWAKSPEERAQIAEKISRARQGVSSRKKVAWSVVVDIREMYQAGYTRKQIAEKHAKLSASMINDIIAYRTYKGKRAPAEQ